jgi:hypothetical protein
MGAGCCCGSRRLGERSRSFSHAIASFAADGKPQRLRWRESDAAEVVLEFPTDS